MIAMKIMLMSKWIKENNMNMSYWEYNQYRDYLKTESPVVYEAFKECYFMPGTLELLQMVCNMYAESQLKHLSI